MHIFIGNLPFSASKEDIKNLFEAFGPVAEISLKKKSGGNSSGFGFVEMLNEAQALEAIAGLNGKEFMDRPLEVTPKRPTIEKPKKDYKEIKRKRQQAKLLATQVVAIKDDVPELKEVKEVKEVKKVKEFKEIKGPKEYKDPRSDKKREAYGGRQGPRVWEKRKGTGKAGTWKKKPGGVKKNFRTER